MVYSTGKRNGVAGDHAGMEDRQNVCFLGPVTGSLVTAASRGCIAMPVMMPAVTLTGPCVTDT